MNGVNGVKRLDSGGWCGRRARRFGDDADSRAMAADQQVNPTFPASTLRNAAQKRGTKYSIKRGASPTCLQRAASPAARVLTFTRASARELRRITEPPLRSR